MNRKGFTLVELLGAIVILAIITAIITPSVMRILKNSDEANYNMMIDNISSVPPGSTLILKFGAYLGNESMLSFKKQIENETGLKVVCIGPDVDVVNYIPPKPDKEDL